MDNVGNVILYTNVVFGWWLVLRTVQQHCVWFWYEWIRYSSVGGLNTVLNIYCSLLHSPPLEVYRLIFFFSMHIVYVCVRVCVKAINLCPILSQNWKVCFFFWFGGMFLNPAVTLRCLTTRTLLTFALKDKLYRMTHGLRRVTVHLQGG